MFKIQLQIADNAMVIISVDTIDITCNLTEGSYINGSQTGVIYDIPSLTVPVGYKIIEYPNKINYFPITTRETIQKIQCELRDQDGNLLKIPSERKFISLKIEPV
jgi:hypothetical protein